MDHRTAGHCTSLLGRTPSAGEVACWRTAEAASDLATSVALATSAARVGLAPPPEGSTQQGEADEVHAYLADIAARWRSAYDRLSPQSQTAIGGYDGSYGSRSALSESIGAFAVVPERDQPADRVLRGPHRRRRARDGGPRGPGGLRRRVVRRARPPGRRVGDRHVHLPAGPEDRPRRPRAGPRCGAGRHGGRARELPGPGGGRSVRSACSPASAGGRSVSVVPDLPLVRGRHVATVMATAPSVLHVEPVVITAR